MLLSVLSVILMTGMFLYMLNRAQFARTRRMALIPLGCVAMELFAAGLLTPILFPVLTVMLIALRMTILLCCVGAMRQDATMARRRARRVKATQPVLAACIPCELAAPGRCA